jgi:hypothetical protein
MVKPVYKLKIVSRKRALEIFRAPCPRSAAPAKTTV